MNIEPKNITSTVKSEIKNLSENDVLSLQGGWEVGIQKWS